MKLDIIYRHCIGLLDRKSKLIELRALLQYLDFELNGCEATIFRIKTSIIFDTNE